MSRPTIRIIDAITGQVTDRLMDDNEFAAYEVEQEKQAAQEAATNARETAKTSARAKLKALGLTDDEIAALIP